MSRFESINPYNYEKIYDFPEATGDQIQKTITESQKVFDSWRKTSFSERAKLLINLANVLKKDADVLAKLATQEMGKLFTEAKAEVLKCAACCDYYAENGEKFLSDREVKSDSDYSFISFQPLGVVLAVMPWNFPFWQVFRFAVPTLMAGNTAILKHSSNVSACALEIEKIFLKAGFPTFVFNTLLLKSDKIPKMIADPAIKAISLTGSTAAGQSVAAEAGKNLKKCVLELGGSDAYVVLEDANIEKAIAVCSQSRLINAGQSCVSAKRFIVAEKFYDQFKQGFIDKFQALRKGDPLATDTQLAPLFAKKAQEDLHEQVMKAQKNGATVAFGGKVPDIKGAFYEPTILENISTKNPAYQEEFFGPVAMLFRATTQKEAFEIANATSFGLGGAVFGSFELATKLAREELQAGSCFVNALVKSDPRLPFGGIKQSGYGRELSEFGIHEFVNIKTVYAQR